MSFFPKSDRRLWIISLAAVALSGCGQNALQPLQGAAPSLVPITSSPEASSTGSWMAPEAAAKDLLYVSDLQNVAVYTYREGKRVGTLKGFYAPSAECADNAGDVFIADGNRVVEYEHGGKKPIRTFTVSGYAAGGCSRDPVTGNLAIPWSNTSNGYVAVYENASGTPALYSNSPMIPTFCGYDGKGNLFVGGTVGFANGFMFAELPKGGRSLVNVTLNQTIGFSGLVQRDGKYIAVEDLTTYKIYRFTIVGSNGTLERATTLDGLGISHQGWIVGHTVVQANIAYINYQPIGQVVYYKYPKGGSSTKTITVGDDTAPWGVAVSRTPH